MKSPVQKVRPSRRFELHPGPHTAAAVPAELWDTLEWFVREKKTGNVKLNFKDGRILGYHVEEIRCLK